jgi:hypothetical protein
MNATKESVLQKVDEQLPELTKWILDKVKYYLNSGAIDIESYEDNYLLPKILLSAIGNDMARQYMPYGDKDKRTVRDLGYF